LMMSDSKLLRATRVPMKGGLKGNFSLICVEGICNLYLRTTE
jgi:hypothetical protein